MYPTVENGKRFDIVLLVNGFPVAIDLYSKDKFNAEDSLSKFLVPYLYSKDLDAEAENVQKNNAARWTDYRVTNYQVASNNDLDQKKAVDPMDAEAFRRYMEELFRGDEAGDEKRDPIQEFVHKFLHGLSDADQAIMFGYFGSCETQQEIGDELGRQVQSVNRTINRIKKRLEKELADKLGYTGQDRHKAEK